MISPGKDVGTSVTDKSSNEQVELTWKTEEGAVKFMYSKVSDETAAAALAGHSEANSGE